MTALLRFSSAPGMLVPGMGQLALVEQGGTTLFPYYGQQALYYLDYVDTATARVLAATPGGTYSMTPVNNRFGLSVPPPDGRWTQGGHAFLAFRPRVRQPTIHEVRALLEKSRAASGWYGRPGVAQPQPRHTTGTAAPVLPPQPTQMQATRADLERARVDHGHYAPGGCKQCMSGGQEG